MAPFAPQATQEAIDAVDIQENPYKKDFPLLANAQDLTFLDSAATAQRAAGVLDAQRDFYERLNSNPLRGLYRLSIEATEAIDKVRRKVADFIGAPLSQEIVFTRNATESLNILAASLGRTILGPGDEVCITIMEHHRISFPGRKYAVPRAPSWCLCVPTVSALSHLKKLRRKSRRARRLFQSCR